MKKFLLPLVVALISLASCTDYTDDFNTINNRLDALEQAVPSIEEQIESINTQLTSLKATDEAIKEQISELEKSDKATATEITDLKKKDSALEKSINDLQKYVDTQIANAKSEAAAAYATIEQYNTIVAQLNTLQGSTDKLGEELTAKINAEVKSLTDKIADLEARLKAVEDKVENLLARIQSVSYIPTYNDNKATLKYISGVSQVLLDFKVSPKECVAELEKIWENAVKVDAVYTKTRAVSFIDMPIVKFEADAENGVISIIASGENLSEEFFAGTQSASASLTISDGNSSVTSEYVPMVAQEADMYQLSVPANQIWYTSTDDNVVEPFNKDGFGAHIVSNTYKNGIGTIVFDAPVTSVSVSAYYNSTTKLGDETLKSIALPEGVTKIGTQAFLYCEELKYVNIPKSVERILDQAFAIKGKNLEKVYITDLSAWFNIAFGSGTANPIWNTNAKLWLNGEELTEITIPSDISILRFAAFYGCDWLTDIVIPDSISAIGGRAFQGCSNLINVTIGNNVTRIAYSAFSGCSNLKSVYCKPTTPPTAHRGASSGAWGVFNNNAKGRLIYVPRASVDAYKAADGWSSYADSIVGYDF
uniref:leucine-rich repeat protein n=1 Tax=Alistipes sp. TaxID=1872444 RepID=UPI004055B689